MATAKAPWLQGQTVAKMGPWVGLGDRPTNTTDRPTYWLGRPSVRMKGLFVGIIAGGILSSCGYLCPEEFIHGVLIPNGGASEVLGEGNGLLYIRCTAPSGFTERSSGTWLSFIS